MSSHNALGYLPAVFSQLHLLRRLDLSHNQLHSLHKLSLQGLGQLQHLVLLNNHLEDVDQQAFAELLDLQVMSGECRAQM